MPSLAGRQGPCEEGGVHDIFGHRPLGCYSGHDRRDPLGRAIPYAAGDPSYGGLLRLSAGLVLLAALLTLGGLLGLDALQGGSSWNVGRAGFTWRPWGCWPRRWRRWSSLWAAKPSSGCWPWWGAWRWWSGWRSTGPLPCKLGCWRVGAGGRSSWCRRSRRC